MAMVLLQRKSRCNGDRNRSWRPSGCDQCVRKTGSLCDHFISKDHMQYLGNTIPEIAGEKAGIIKAGVPVVFDDTDKDAGAVISAKAK